MTLLFLLSILRAPSCALFPYTTLFRSSDIAGVSASDLNPVKTLESASDKVGDSVSALNPVNNLSTTSEEGRGTRRNSSDVKILQAVFCLEKDPDPALNQVKTLHSASAV